MPKVQQLKMSVGEDQSPAGRAQFLAFGAGFGQAQQRHGQEFQMILHNIIAEAAGAGLRSFRLQLSTYFSTLELLL